MSASPRRASKASGVVGAIMVVVGRKPSVGDDFLVRGLQVVGPDEAETRGDVLHMVHTGTATPRGQRQVSNENMTTKYTTAEQGSERLLSHPALYCSLTILPILSTQVMLTMSISCDSI